MTASEEGGELEIFSSDIYLLKDLVCFFLLEAHGLADVLEGLDGSATGAGGTVP
jgi:hypothetical protein